MHQGLFQAIILLVFYYALQSVQCLKVYTWYVVYNARLLVSPHFRPISTCRPIFRVPIDKLPFSAAAILKMLSSWLEREVIYIHKLIVFLTSLSNMCLLQGDDFLPSTWEIHRQTCGCMFSCTPYNLCCQCISCIAASIYSTILDLNTACRHS